METRGKTNRPAWNYWALLAAIVAVSLLFFLEGVELSLVHRRESGPDTWLHGTATVAGKQPARNRFDSPRLLLDGDITGGTGPVPVPVRTRVYMESSIGEELHVWRNAALPDRYRVGTFRPPSREDAPAWLFFLGSAVILLMAVVVAVKFRGMPAFRASRIRRTRVRGDYLARAVPCGFGALFSSVLVLCYGPFLHTTPETIRAEGTRHDATVAGKTLEYHYGRKSGAPTCWLTLEIPDAPEDRRTASVRVRPRTFIRCSKGDLLTVWYWNDQYRVDADGNLDEPHSIPLFILFLLLAALCIHLFVLNIRLARRAPKTLASPH